MTRRFIPPQPLITATTPSGALARVYRRRWLTVTEMQERWHQRGLWWLKATTPDQAWLATDRHYALITVDQCQVWEVFQTSDGSWFLERIVLH